MPLGVSVHIDTSGIGIAMSETQSRSATLKAVRAGIKVIQPVAKGLAPKRFGALKTAQGTKAVKGRKGKTGSFALQGARSKYKRFRKGKKIVPAFYDHLVIGGTRPHSIRKGSKLARTRVSKRTGKSKTSAEVGQGVGKPHPGSRKNAYRLRAYRATRSAVMREMKRVMGIELQKILYKANLKTLAGLKKNVLRAASTLLG